MVDRESALRVGRAIKVARFRLGINQEELADRIGRAVSTVSSYERGAKRDYTPEELARIEAALDIRDKALQVEAGLTRRPEMRDGRPALIYEGALLDEKQETEVLLFIDWLRFRADRDPG